MVSTMKSRKNLKCYIWKSPSKLLKKMIMAWYIPKVEVHNLPSFPRNMDPDMDLTHKPAKVCKNARNCFNSKDRQV